MQVISITRRITINAVLILLQLQAGLAGYAQSLPFTSIDKKVSQKTKALYKNLYKLSRQYILFGHQHATEYGHGWRGDRDRSDVKSVTGSHPAVVGVDFMGLSGQPDSIIERNMNALRENIKATYQRGGITTVSWHFSNPLSAGGFYWKDSVSASSVKLMQPGAAANETYKKILRTIAGFAKSVRGRHRKLVPMIFRPYHEFDGDWFWWGKSHCSAEEFKALWRFTVSYLRDTMQVHNFIYAFSPDCTFTSEEELMERYPGDEWVDMVGMDDYHDFGRYGKYTLDSGYMRLKIISDYAKKNGKLAAFTETGLESIPDAGWWTDSLLGTLKRSNLKLCYVLVWRNDTQSTTHYYAPFPGHPSVADFIRFYNDPYTLFGNDLKNIYR
jgi:mannan endo-1,4-beta-mannosidase